MMNDANKPLASKNSLLLAALGIGLIIALWIQLPSLLDPVRSNDDLRNLYWLHRMVEPSLFAGDTLLGHQLLEFKIGEKVLVINKFSPGFALLFILSKSVGSVVLFSKLLIFPLMFISIIFLFRLGSIIGTRETALALCFGFSVLNLILSSNISVAGGLQRSFALPLMIALLYYLSSEKYWRAAFIVFLSSSIYPPIFVLGAATFGISLLKFRNTNFKGISVHQKAIPPLMAATLLGGLLLLPAAITQEHDQISTTLNQSDSPLTITSIQEGRYPLFTFFPFIGAGGIASGADGLNIMIMVIIAVGTKFLIKQKSQPLPHVVVSLIMASIVCFVISWLAILITNSFLLYLPSRYAQSTIIIFLLFYFVLNGKVAMQLAAQKLTRASQTPITAILIISVLIVAVISYGWLNFPSKSLFLVFAGVLVGLWLAIVILLSTHKLRQPSHNIRHAHLKPTNLSTKEWAILGAIIFLGLAFYGRLFDGDITLSDNEQSLVAYLETLPEDTRLGGTPCTLDSVPLFAKRMILFSCETPSSNPVIMQEALESYYAEDAQTINSFCQKHDIDYLVIDQDTYDEAYIDEGKFLFEPFDSFMKQELPDNQKYFLANLSPEMILYQNNSLIVTPCPLNSAVNLQSSQ